MERFYVMEHDSYLEDPDEFKRQFDFTMEHGLDYANHGLFMSCYSFSRRCAIYMNDLLLKRGFPLNGGPYGCVERLVKTYLSNNNDNNRPYTFMTHHPNTENVSVGATAKELYKVYNRTSEDSMFSRSSTNAWMTSQSVVYQNLENLDSITHFYVPLQGHLDP